MAINEEGRTSSPLQGSRESLISGLGVKRAVFGCNLIVLIIDERQGEVLWERLYVSP